MTQTHHPSVVRSTAGRAERENHAGEASSIFEGYKVDAKEEIPLGGYAALVGAYTVLACGIGAGLRRSEQQLPARLALRDLLLFGVATHKLARLITKDWVTSPLRAPFTKFARDEGGGEVTDVPRGSGLRRAFGALVTCPWCIAPWIALPLAAGAVVWPRATRFVAGVLATVAISDTLQHVYNRTKQLNES